MSTFKIGMSIHGLHKLFAGDIKKVIESVRLADEIGIDQLSLTDHVVMGENVDRYPYGNFPVPLSEPWFEPLSVLAGIAAVTNHIRLSTSVLISPLRSAVLLAKQLATLDVMSGGRVDIGVGVGWQEEEYIASGIPFDKRYTRMENQIRACRQLWSESPTSFSSSTVSFERMHSRPFPVQGSALPVWFGISASQRNCQRIAELGQGWIPISKKPDIVAEGVKNIHKAMAELGRDPGQLAVRAGLETKVDENGTPDFAATLTGLDAMLDAGATMVEFMPIIYCRSADELPAFYKKLASIKG